MKLGIKTTGGVAKLKTKTTDGVTKAVECECCKCNPDAPWGPGYDDRPSEIQVLGFTLWRIGSCRWHAEECGCGSTIIEAPTCPDGCDYYDHITLNLPGEYQYSGYGYDNDVLLVFNRFIGGLFSNNYVSFLAIRTGGDHPAPYGIYSIVEAEYAPGYNIGDTLTISPP